MKQVLLKKSSGDVGVGSMITTTALMLIMIALMKYSFHKVEMTFIKTALRDGVDIVCLSTVIPDMDELVEDVKDSIVFDPNNGFSFNGSSSELESGVDIIVDTEASYNRFYELLEMNVINVVDNVDVSDVCVNVLTIYCVNGNDIDEYCFTEEGRCNVIKHPNMKGDMDSPNGVTITNTSVYVELDFTYKDVFGTKHEGLSVENYKAVSIK